MWESSELALMVILVNLIIYYLFNSKFLIFKNILDGFNRNLNDPLILIELASKLDSNYSDIIDSG